MTSTKVFNAADTAVILRIKLGPLRSWPDFLSDNIRGKQNLAGFVLMPCARVKGAHGFQPYYALSDINAFVAAVCAAMPEAGAGKPLKGVELKAASHRHWRYNKFDRTGAPIARRRSITTH